MTRALNLLAKRIRRRFPSTPFEYIAVWETHKNGYPHIHLIARGPFLPQRVLSRWWHQLNGSPVVDVRRVHSPNGATHYLTKYLTKSPSVPFGFRHWRTSRNFWSTPGGMFPRSPADGVHRALRTASIYAVASNLQRIGYRVTYEGSGTFHAHPDFLHPPPADTLPRRSLQPNSGPVAPRQG